MMDYQILALDLDGTLNQFQKGDHTSDQKGTDPDTGKRNQSSPCKRTPYNRASFLLQRNCSWNALEATFSPSTADAHRLPEPGDHLQQTPSKKHCCTSV